MTHTAARLHCSHDKCEETVADHYWGRVKSGWFFSMQKPGEQWCPQHIPEWVAEWRAKRDGVIEEDPRPLAVVAEGIWCEDCGYYEDDDIEKDSCPACGCARTRHIPVKVVRS